MRIDFPAPSQTRLLRRLWANAFGDSEAFLDSFFSTAFSPARCRCVTMGEDIAAALYWFDVTCEGQKMAYIYAVATAPAYRNQGFCRRLMEDTHAHLTLRGYQGAMLVPEGEGLVRLYQGLGYAQVTTHREFLCAAGDTPAPMHRIDREEYARLRRDYLPKGGVVQEGENLLFLESQAQFYTGLGFLVAVVPEKESLFCPELLGNAGAAPALLLALGLGFGTFRTPGEGKSFAMFLPLSADAVTPRYFGFAFD